MKLIEKLNKLIEAATPEFEYAFIDNKDSSYIKEVNKKALTSFGKVRLALKMKNRLFFMTGSQIIGDTGTTVSKKKKGEAYNYLFGVVRDYVIDSYKGPKIDSAELWLKAERFIRKEMIRLV